MKEQKFEDVKIWVGSCEGVSIWQTITAEEQKDFVEKGYGTAAEYIKWVEESYVAPYGGNY